MHDIQEYSGSWQRVLNTPAVVSCLLLCVLSKVPALLLSMALLPFAGGSGHASIYHNDGFP